MEMKISRKSEVLDTIYIDTSHYDIATKDFGICSKTKDEHTWINKLGFCLDVPEQDRMNLFYPIFGYSFEKSRVYIFRVACLVLESRAVYRICFQLSYYFECDFLENIGSKLKLLGGPYEFHREWLMKNLAGCGSAIYLGADGYYDKSITLLLHFKKIEPNCIKIEDLIKLSELWLVGKQIYLYETNDGNETMWELDCETAYYPDKANITHYWPMFLKFFLGKMEGATINEKMLNGNLFLTDAKGE